MTAFALSGRHRTTACGACHHPQARAAQPQALGWLRALPAPPSLDLTFPSPGPGCANCHHDPHQGRRGDACGSCHTTASFGAVRRGVHDTGAFRLNGAHDQLACGRCHTDNQLLAGTGDLCRNCHTEDDVHHGGLGLLCGECHGQLNWLPARFLHGQVGVVLRGAHRVADCDGCHPLGTFQGTPTACDTCHLGDAAAVVDPIHNQELTDCALCHTELSFIPARHHHPTFALRGAHATLWCRSCHNRGTYAGTPSACYACHRSQYENPANEPNHVAAGFAYACDDCHTTVAWQPARAP